MLPFRPIMLAAVSAVLLLGGCAAKPAPIVLNPPRSAHHLTQREIEAQRRRAANASAPAPLTPAQKEALFRDFDSYLHQPGTD